MKPWQCTNCGAVAHLPRGVDPNRQNRPCGNCMLAPPMMGWIER